MAVSDTISLDVYPEPDASYTGARLGPEGAVTLGFVQQLLEDLKAQKVLHKRYAFQVVLAVKAVLAALPTVVEVPVPEGTHLTVCGDVHGQFYDLLNIFDINGLVRGGACACACAWHGMAVHACHSRQGL